MFGDLIGSVMVVNGHKLGITSTLQVDQILDNVGRKQLPRISVYVIETSVKTAEEYLKGNFPRETFQGQG